jgi:cell division protein FtsB
MHPALLISLVLLLNFLSFLAGRNFEENKQDDQKMQLRIQMDKVKTEITTKDAQIEELRKELEAKEVDIA